jgi:outer membrane protein TolC
MQQYALSVATTFWRCIADDRALDIADEANRHSAAYGDTMAKMVRQGLVEPTIQQQWAANNVAQQLNLGKAQDESQKCRRDLAYAMTGSTAEPWPMAAGELPIVADLAPGVGQIGEGAMDDLAIARRQDLKAAADNLMAAREAMRSSDNDTRPELNLNLDPDRAIISFTKAFGSNVAKGRRAQASADESKADLALRQLQDQVRMQVSDALVSLRRTASDWRALEDAERQMETVVVDAEKRAKFGSITWANLLDTQNQLTQLRQQVINARLQFAIALGNLRLATGTIDADQPSILASDITRPPTP